MSEISDLYKELGSIRAVAREVGCSGQKVRKFLITEGAYTTPRIQEINELISNGFSVEQIQQKLKISKAAVNMCLPYARAPIEHWNDSKKSNHSKSAFNIQLCRMRKKSKRAAARFAVGLKQSEAAEQLGCTQKDISRWENGTNPSAETLLAMSRTYNCKIEDLI